MSILSWTKIAFTNMLRTCLNTYMCHSLAASWNNKNSIRRVLLNEQQTSSYLCDKIRLVFYFLVPHKILCTRNRGYVSSVNNRKQVSCQTNPAPNENTKFKKAPTTRKRSDTRTRPHLIAVSHRMISPFVPAYTVASCVFCATLRQTAYRWPKNWSFCVSLKNKCFDDTDDKQVDSVK